MPTSRDYAAFFDAFDHNVGVANVMDDYAEASFVRAFQHGKIQEKTHLPAFPVWFHHSVTGQAPPQELDAPEEVIAAALQLPRARLQAFQQTGRFVPGVHLDALLKCNSKSSALLIMQVLAELDDPAAQLMRLDAPEPLFMAKRFDKVLAYVMGTGYDKLAQHAFETAYLHIAKHPEAEMDSAGQAGKKKKGGKDKVAVEDVVVSPELLRLLPLLQLSHAALVKTCRALGVCSITFTPPHAFTQQNLEMSRPLPADQAAKIMEEIAIKPKYMSTRAPPPGPYIQDCPDMPDYALRQLKWKCHARRLHNVRFVDGVMAADYFANQKEINDMVARVDVAHGKMFHATGVRSGGTGGFVDMAAITLVPCDVPSGLSDVTDMENKVALAVRGYGDNMVILAAKDMTVDESNVLKAAIVATNDSADVTLSALNGDHNASGVYYYTGLMLVRAWVPGKSTSARAIGMDIGCAIADFALVHPLGLPVDFDPMLFQYIPKHIMPQGEDQEPDPRAFWALTATSTPTHILEEFCTLLESAGGLLECPGPNGSPAKILARIGGMCGRCPKKTGIKGNHFIKKLFATRWTVNVAVHCGGGNVSARFGSFIARICAVAGPAANEYVDELVDTLTQIATIYAQFVRRYIAAMTAHASGLVVIPGTAQGHALRIAVDPVLADISGLGENAARHLNSYCEDLESGLGHNIVYYVAVRNDDGTPRMIRGAPVYLQVVAKGGCLVLSDQMQIAASHDVMVFIRNTHTSRTCVVTRAQMHRELQGAAPAVLTMAELMEVIQACQMKLKPHGAGRCQSTTKTASEVTHSDIHAYMLASGVGNLAPLSNQNHPGVGYKSGEDVLQTIDGHGVVSQAYWRREGTFVDYQQEEGMDLAFPQYIMDEFFGVCVGVAVVPTKWPVPKDHKYAQLEVCEHELQFKSEAHEKFFFARVAWPSCRLFACYLLLTTDGFRRTLYDMFGDMERVIVERKLRERGLGMQVPTETWATDHHAVISAFKIDAVATALEKARGKSHFAASLRERH